MSINQVIEVDDAEFEITRVKYGSGFRYLDKHGKAIQQKDLLRRLKKLVIPPMWTDVCISQWEDGHVQATGRDKKNRKQYIYHNQWEKQRQQEKFNKMLEFGQKLPKIRRHCEQLLTQQGWPKDKVLALVVTLLDETGIRIGNQKYTEENESYGLTTLRRKHLSEVEGKLVFCYQGKSNQQRQVDIKDETLIAHIKKAAEQPGYEIFRYQESANRWQNIDSEEVNEFIHDLAGKKFYSKDFRTWVATRLAVEKYPEALAQKAQNPRKKMTNILLRSVADEIGNTPTVCKDYYVHPAIMQLIDQSKLPNMANTKSVQQQSSSGLMASEDIVLKVLSDTTT